MGSENQQLEPVYSWAGSLAFAKGTDVGHVRDHNEDYVDAFSPPDLAQRQQKGILFIVADGMGGHQAGDVASRTAVEMVSHEYYADPDTDIRASLVRAIKKANAVIHEEAQRVASRAGMGTTIVAAVVRERELLLANVGDSRAYMMRQGKVAQATRDHSFVADQVRAGLLSAEEARVHPQRNVITRALGSRPEVQVDTFGGEMQPGDALLLCTDGLSEYVRDDDMLAVLQGTPPAEGVKRLIAMARERGGSDNISALVVRVDTPAAWERRSPDRPASQKPKPRERRLFPWLAAGVALVGLVGVAILATVLVVLPRMQADRQAGASPTAPSIDATAEATPVSTRGAPTVEATDADVETAQPSEEEAQVPESLGFTLDSPADQSTVPPGTVEFRWQWAGPAPDELVEFVVNSDQGELCKAGPDADRCQGIVQPGTEYEWWVEYQARGLKLHESDRRRFTAGPQADGTPEVTVTVTLSSTTATDSTSSTEAISAPGDGGGEHGGGTALATGLPADRQAGTPDSE